MYITDEHKAVAARKNAMDMHNRLGIKSINELIPTRWNGTR